VTQDDLALRIAGLRPGETPLSPISWHRPRVRFHPRRGPSADCAGRCRTRTGARSEAHTTIDPDQAVQPLEPLAHVGDSGGQIDPCGWTQSKHGFTLAPVHSLGARTYSDQNQDVPRSGARPRSTTASPQLGSCCVGDFLAANSTGTNRPPRNFLVFLFQRVASSDGDPACRSSNPTRQNSLRRMPLLTNSATNC
jgi:hypothetical protein